jgi:Ca-activated chloride channel homolog
LQIGVGDAPVISCSAQRILRPFLPWVLAVSTAAIAQSAIDGAHIRMREPKTVDVASAEYSAPYSGGLIRTSADLVLVPVSITDDRNRSVLGLEQSNFQLFENKKLQEIKNFSSEDTPVSVGILLDTSGSMSYKLERAREAVFEFCEASNPQDEFFLIAFSDQPRLVTDFTPNSGNVKQDLLSIRSHGRTSLLDAIYLGLTKMRAARYARKALLVISDGGDNHSRYSERDVRSAVRESDVSIYAIGTYDRWVSTEEERRGPELLKTIADSTGGLAFSLGNAGEMPSVTRSIGDHLRHQYVLAYTPAARTRDGKWHKINVKLRLPKKFSFLHVAARPGYYAGGN